MSNSPLEDFLQVVRKYHVPFVGFTVQSHIYSLLLRRTKPDIWGRRFPVPVYEITNQPCAIVKWTSQKLMMKYVRRKEREFYGDVSQQNTTD